MYNADKFKRFVLCSEISAHGGTVTFRTYTDTANAHKQGYGVAVQYVEGTNENGRPRGKWFSLDQSHRQFRCVDGQKDTTGLSMYDFIRFSPYCEGSPNLKGDPLYRELNEERDAAIVLEADEARIKAGASALELDDQTLSEMGAFIGQFGKPDKIMRLKVVEWAQRHPEEYNKILADGDRPYRALIRKGIKDGELETKGEIILWAGTVIGSDESAAVRKLMDDKDILDTLSAKLKLNVEANEPKKRGPKPK